MMVGSSLMFSIMGVCVKYASDQYSAGELVFYRGLVGAITLGFMMRWQRVPLRTPVPLMHVWRSVVGISSLALWFYAIAHLPLATSMTLNYMSSVWMGFFMLSGAVMFGRGRVDAWLIFALLLGFGGVAAVLRPTVAQDQLWPGLMGLMSGMIAALAYLQVSALGRAGEPETRVVFYFSVGGMALGAIMAFGSGWHGHTWGGAGLLLGVGACATGAQLMLTRAYTTGKPLVNASLQYLGIAWSFLFGVVFFGDAVTWLAVGGMALIVGAGLIATRARQSAPVAASAVTEA